MALLTSHLHKAIFIVVLLSSATAASAKSIDIRFPRGPGTTVEETIVGDQVVSHEVEVSAGTTMFVRLESDNANAHFSVTPNGVSKALYDSVVDGADTTFQLKSPGSYVVAVYLLGDSQLTNDTARYELAFQIEKAPDADFGARRRLSPIVLELSWMPDFCRGEANAEFSARGTNVMARRNRLETDMSYKGLMKRQVRQFHSSAGSA